ncbi:D-alanyl-D-alanine carboxypeptidase family protein [Cellulomonas sp. C5510]|uniref:M15 family metallopeptidase n=1 Tax=Cellulomonas sp. C5510 TaxID=2871170 RepID=UPI001C97E911|nr:M15 family metallopeptidase [Cellulomonas sp. C5510]QZN85086.1 M15 family metallopeptidase [Cellulomonas sp. C5510]
MTSAPSAPSRSSAPSGSTPSVPPVRDSAPTGRRAAAPGGRRVAGEVGARGAHRAEGRASVRTPARGVVVPATLATADLPPNRAERRRRRAPRRSSTRVAQGAVALGLALGVGGFALAPVGADRGLLGAREARPLDAADPTPSAPAAAPAPDPETVRERGTAVVLASTVAQDADNARAEAEAAAVPADAVAELSTAVAELDTLIATTQAEQPAIAALAPEDAPAPVLSGDALSDAVADAAADAAAEEGATTTSGTVGEPEAAPTGTGATDVPGATAGDLPEADAPGDDAAEAETADPAAARLTAAVERVSTLTAELQVVTQRTQEAAAAAAEAARKEAQRTSLDAYANGQIPSSALCELGFAPGQQLRCDAAEALEQLDVAFAAAFGTHLVITDSYRSYGQQVACRQQKGSLCATPGTSNHGTGTAVDLGGDAYAFGTDQHDWMLAHAEEYGWTLPDWARVTGSKPEPWHWEYVG